MDMRKSTDDCGFEGCHHHFLVGKVITGFVWTLEFAVMIISSSRRAHGLICMLRK